MDEDLNMRPTYQLAYPTTLPAYHQSTVVPVLPLYQAVYPTRGQNTNEHNNVIHTKNTNEDQNDGARRGISRSNSNHSQIQSERGDNNEISTLSVRPYTSSLPQTGQTILYLTPPYLNAQQPVYGNNSNTGYVYLGDNTHTNLLSEEDSSLEHQKRGPSPMKGTYTVRQCALIMCVLFLLSFVLAVFMAVHYGNSFDV